MDEAGKIEPVDLNDVEHQENLKSSEKCFQAKEKPQKHPITIQVTWEELKHIVNSETRVEDT